MRRCLPEVNDRVDFLTSYQLNRGNHEPAYWFAFSGYKLLVEVTEKGFRVPVAVDRASFHLTPVRSQYLGLLNGKPCYSAECSPAAPAPVSMEFKGLRGLFGDLGEELFSIAGRALLIMDWDRTHQFCGQCGTPTADKTSERAKVCTQCGLVDYPRMSPAIIVAVKKGEQLLLARASRFPDGLYSVIAGFVEPGESLEECLQREVREETGIEVNHIRYFGSQAWPFPNSLMIGFTADHARGEIAIDGREVVDAGWFAAENLPTIPERLSIARRLIDHSLAKNDPPS
jgi:NAD+ diphosphatase